MAQRGWHLLFCGLALGAIACGGPTDPDSGAADAGDGDGGASDAGSLDASSVDASLDASLDASSLDAGPLDAGSQVPSIEAAGLCDVVDPSLSVSAGPDLQRVTLGAPNALCNDGSPAILYVSPAPAGSPDADRWFIWLEGGRGCRSPADCGDRWCGRQAIYSAAKMSSRFAPDSVAGTGVFNRTPGGEANRFAGYNHVMAYYCSSDGWTGLETAELTDETEQYPDFRIRFHGAHIVTAMIEALRAGAVSDDGAVTLPSIDEASQVIFSGTSAGAGGVRLTADRVRTLLQAGNPDVDLRAVIDAAVFPQELDLPDVTAEVVEEFLDASWATAMEFRTSELDASCLEMHAADPRICADPTHTMIHHLTTPWYAKMDLSDGTPGFYASPMRYTRAMFDLLRSFDDLPTWSEEVRTRPGVFGPHCDHHVNLESSDFYQVRLAPTGTSDGVSNNEALWRWMSGDTVAMIHAPAMGLESICP